MHVMTATQVLKCQNKAENSDGTVQEALQMVPFKCYIIIILLSF